MWCLSARLTIPAGLSPHLLEETEVSSSRASHIDCNIHQERPELFKQRWKEEKKEWKAPAKVCL